VFAGNKSRYAEQKQNPILHTISLTISFKIYSQKICNSTKKIKGH